MNDIQAKVLYILTEYLLSIYYSDFPYRKIKKFSVPILHRSSYLTRISETSTNYSSLMEYAAKRHQYRYTFDHAAVVSQEPNRVLVVAAL